MVGAGNTEEMSYPAFRRAGSEHPSQIHPEQASQTPGPEPADTTEAKLLASLSEAVALLQYAQEEIESLQAQLLEAKESHRKVTIELMAVEMREGEARATLNHGLAAYTDIQRQALREEILRQEARRQRAWWRLGR